LLFLIISKPNFLTIKDFKNKKILAINIANF